MKSKTLNDTLKTGALIFTIDFCLSYFLRTEFRIFAALLFLLYCNYKEKNTLIFKDKVYKKSSKGLFYHQDLFNQALVYKLDPEQTQELIKEKNQIQNIPNNTIEGGAEIFDYIIAKIGT